MMKIIQILHHSLSTINEKADPRFYEEDWHVKVGKRVKKLAGKYDIECWRPEKNLETPYVREGDDGITYRIFPSKYLLKFEYSPSMLKKLQEVLNEEVIIHLHGIVYPNSYIILKSINKDVPIVAQSHEASPTLSEALFKRTHFKYIKKLEFPFKMVESSLQNHFFKNINYFFCLSNDEKDSYSKFSDNITIQPMGIDFNKFKQIDRKRALNSLELPDQSYILYVGRLNKIKGLDYLLKGFKKILANEDKTLLLAGEGPYRNKVESLSKKLGIEDNVKILGYIPHKMLPYYYNVSDMTIFPSITDCYPIVPMESLACRTPLLATNVGAVQEITNNYKGGFKIIPPFDSDAIWKGFRSLDVDGIKTQIDIKNAEKHYDWDNIIKNTVKVYDKLYEKYYG